MNFVACWFFSSSNFYINSLVLVKLILVAKLVSFWLFSRQNLYIDFYNRETDFDNRTCQVLIYVLGTCCAPIVACWFFFSRNLYIDLSSREDDFVHENHYVLIFFCGTCFLFVFVKLVHYFFSLLNWFCSRNLLRVDFLFVDLIAVWFFILWMCYIDFFSSWNWFCYWNLLLVDFMHGTCCCWFLFMKLVEAWFFSSWIL